ncbi:hypothetical protein HYV85_03035 [Candidatus Woesearchaeota archaeon]|nr:hypothetical protein [Candidatus Woesearchaeota archaeon]
MAFDGVLAGAAFLIDPKVAVATGPNRLLTIWVFLKGHAAAVLKRVVLNKKGIDLSPRTIIAFVLLLAAAVVLFLMLKSVMCRTGTWEC